MPAVYESADSLCHAGESSGCPCRKLNLRRVELATPYQLICSNSDEVRNVCKYRFW